MARHLNLSTIVDKNKIESDKVFLVLFSIDVKDSEGVLVETLRFVKNSENVIAMGETYYASSFTMDMKVEQGQEPSLTLTAHDYTRALATYVDRYDGLVKCEARMLVMHEDSLDGPAELDENFLITDSSISDYVVKLSLGVESAVALRFPPYRQFQNRCSWKYKGQRCQYAGALPSCDFTRDGPNGCIAHDNEINFGGFPGLNNLF